MNATLNKKAPFILFILILPFSAGNVACTPGEIMEDTVAQTNAASGYPVVHTNQTVYFDNTGEIAVPDLSSPFYGQDASYMGHKPSYTNNKNGTITDNVTGLMWTQSPDIDHDGRIDVNDKLTHPEALDTAKLCETGGYNDWRLPNIKELYSLIIFSGKDVSGYNGTNESDLTPFINTQYFDFGYGDTNAGERIIDAQFASSTQYVDLTMNGDETVFGVNFADGRIKGYGLINPMGYEKTFYVYFVRGHESYGHNEFVNNGDETITDTATGLMWTANDSGTGMNWQEALEYARENTTAGYNDWRLPNIKELQSIVNYNRSPGKTGSAAIDPVFQCTPITNEAGQTDYPCYWSSTTHASMRGADAAAYISFGRAMGYMFGWKDVHGAGAQRSDPKSGDAKYYPYGHGPQGDAIRIDNYVRLVRSIE